MNMKIMALVLLCGLVPLCYADGAKCNVDVRDVLSNKFGNTCCMYATAGTSPFDSINAKKRKSECEYAECTQIFWGWSLSENAKWILAKIKIDPSLAKAIDNNEYTYFIVDYCNGKIIKACEFDNSDDCKLYKTP